MMYYNYGRACPECGKEYTCQVEGKSERKICYSCNWDVIRHLKEILKFYTMDVDKKEGE